MSKTDSIIYCSQLSMSRESSTRGSTPASTPSSSPSISFLPIPLICNEKPKSPVEVIAKKRGTSYHNLTISTTSFKKKSIYLRSPKVSSCCEFSNSPYTDSFCGSPCLNSSITINSPYIESPESSNKAIKKPLYMLPISKPILVTNNNYVNSTSSFFKIRYSKSKLHKNEFSFIPVNDKYEYIKGFKDNSYSCHSIKFSKRRSVLTNSKGTTILNIKKREILNSNNEKICNINYLNKLDEHFKIVAEITNKFDNEKVTIVCVCDAYNQTSYIYNNYPDKGGNVIGYISRVNNFEKKINRGWIIEITAKVDIPLILAIAIYNLKGLTEIISK